MSFYVFETKYKHARTCDECGKGMSEGYLHDWSSDTFCSEKCTKEHFGSNDSESAIRHGILFWTTWYDEVEVAE